MPSKKWTLEAISAEALRYTTRTEFQRSSKGAYLAAFRGKILDKVCAHMDRVIRTDLTKEQVLEIAFKYQSPRAFQKGDGAAYNAAHRNGWSEAFAHMRVTRKERTKDEILAVSRKYKTRTEFAKGSWGDYLWAKRRGWLEEVCQGMTRAPSSGGFKSDAPAYLYQIHFILPDGESVWKVGITNKSPTARMSGLRAKRGIKKVVTHAIHYDVGSEAREEEKRLHKIGASVGAQYDGKPFLESGNTELFRIPLLVNFA